MKTLFDLKLNPLSFIIFNLRLSMFTVFVNVNLNKQNKLKLQQIKLLVKMTVNSNMVLFTLTSNVKVSSSLTRS